MEIASNLDILSDVYWAISNVKFYKLACPKKCVLCNHITCINCGKNMIFKSGVCSCDMANDFYDFADTDQKINCLGNFFIFFLVTKIRYFLKFINILLILNTIKNNKF